MRSFLCLCVMIAGCGVGDRPPTPMGNGEPDPTAADVAEQARLQEVSDIAERNDRELERLIKEGQAAGIENEVRAAIDRLILASNARLVEEGDLSAVRWFEQQVCGKTPTQLVAAFPEE